MPRFPSEHWTLGCLCSRACRAELWNAGKWVGSLREGLGEVQDAGGRVVAAEGTWKGPLRHWAREHFVSLHRLSACFPDQLTLRCLLCPRLQSQPSPSRRPAPAAFCLGLLGAGPQKPGLSSHDV